MTATDRCPLVPVILAGGQGSRLWPLSRSEQPKQFLELGGHRSLLMQTLERLDALRAAGPVAPALLLCPEEQRFAVAETVLRAGIQARLLLEPEARGTAAALALACCAVAADEDPLLLVLPADHALEPASALGRAVAQARPAAEAGALVLLGITPDRAATGYGYIRVQEGDAGVARAVTAFIEKPGHDAAQALLDRGDCYWNAGIFLARASTFRTEFMRHAPEIFRAAEQALQQGSVDADFIRPERTAFAAAPCDSIDYALIEHTDSARVVPLDGDWSDLGSFHSLWQRAQKDGAGNALEGPVVQVGGRNNLLISEGPELAVLGLEACAVVACRDAVLVAPLAAEGALKTLLEQVRQRAPERLEHAVHQRRPWGCFEVLDRGPGFQVKRLRIDPGKGISRQFHRQRAEHWVVVRGQAWVLRGEEQFVLTANQSTYIPPLMVHQLRNDGAEPIELIEVQTGAYLGEDDIVRISR